MLCNELLKTPFGAEEKERRGKGETRKKSIYLKGSLKFCRLGDLDLILLFCVFAGSVFVGKPFIDAS